MKTSTIYLLLVLSSLLFACGEDDTVTTPDIPLLSQITLSNTSTSASLLINYTYNNDGRISFIEIFDGDEIIRTVAYEFGSDGRINTATISQLFLGQLVPYFISTYTYNDTGNNITITTTENPQVSASPSPSSISYFLTNGQITSIQNDNLFIRFFFDGDQLDSSIIGDQMNDITSTGFRNPLFSQERIVAPEFGDRRISLDLFPAYDGIIASNSTVFNESQIFFYEATVDEAEDDLPLQMTVEGEEVYTFTYLP